MKVNYQIFAKISYFAIFRPETHIFNTNFAKKWILQHKGFIHSLFLRWRQPPVPVWKFFVRQPIWRRFCHTKSRNVNIGEGRISSDAMWGKNRKTGKRKKRKMKTRKERKGFLTPAFVKEMLAIFEFFLIYLHTMTYKCLLPYTRSAFP